MSLASVRGKSINSLTENSIEAQQCKLHFDIARKFILRDSDWQFARKSVALQLLTTVPLRWAYAYKYPGDCLNLKMVTADYSSFNAPIGRIFEASGPTCDFFKPEFNLPFEIQSGTGDGPIIATDQIDAFGVYVKDETVVERFDPLLVTAFVHYLASLVAVPIMGGDFGMKMRNDALQLYSAAISSAVAGNMNEQKRAEKRQPCLISARL
jgi:hypothetical protein